MPANGAAAVQPNAARQRDASTASSTRRRSTHADFTLTRRRRPAGRRSMRRSTTPRGPSRCAATSARAVHRLHRHGRDRHQGWHGDGALGAARAGRSPPVRARRPVVDDAHARRRARPASPPTPPSTRALRPPSRPGVGDRSSFRCARAGGRPRRRRPAELRRRRPHRAARARRALRSRPRYTVELTTGIAGHDGTRDGRARQLELHDRHRTCRSRARTPAPLASGISPAAVVRAVFSRAVDAATLTGTSFRLDGPGGSLGPGAACPTTPPTRTATLTPPTPARAADATYTATRRRRRARGRRRAARPRATWSFTTAVERRRRRRR